MHFQLRYFLNNFNANQIINTSEITTPLYNKFLESQKYSALKTILSTVQFGATGYILYKHLKKYGFLKKK